MFVQKCIFTHPPPSNLYTRPSIYVYIYIYACICLHVYVFTYMYIHQHICIHENMYPPPSNFCPSILALSADRASAVALYLHKYIYTCVRTYIYVCMIYTHTPTSNFCSSNLALSSARACAVALELLSTSAASISV